MPRKDKKKKKQERRGAGARRYREDAKRESSSLFALPDGGEIFKIEKAGAVRLDIIPYKAGEGNPAADEGETYFERTFWIHRSVGVNEEWVICPAKTLGKKCPVCEFISKLSQDVDNDELVNALKLSKRMLINVVDMKNDAETVKTWHVSTAYFGNALVQALDAAYEDEDDNMDFFYEAEGGHFLKCFAEKGWQGRGFSVERVDFKARKEDLDDDILEQAACLDEVLVVKDYDDLKDLLFAGEGDGGKDEKKSKKGKKDKKKEKEKDTDLEDMDEDELIEFMKEKGFKIKGYKKMDEEDLKEAIEEAIEEAIAAKEEKEKEKDKDDEPDFDDMDEDEMIEFIKDGKHKIKGYKKMDEEELREALEEYFKETKEKKDKKKDKKSKKKECPHDGEFGVDTDDLKECDDCKLWDDCDTAKDEASGK